MSEDLRIRIEDLKDRLTELHDFLEYEDIYTPHREPENLYWENRLERWKKNIEEGNDE